MSAQPNYARFPGSGDLPGDRNHPNSPDYDDAAHEAAREEALEAYAKQLVREDEVTELVRELYAASSPILAALTRVRAPDFDTVTVMQRLRSLVRSVEAA